MTNPHNREFEESPKITPNEDEIAFMNNVGLLFHKSLVARELKYILEYYEDSGNEIYEETRVELIRVLQQVRELFKNGIDILLLILQHQVNNIPLLTYVLENKTLVEKATGMKLIEILKFISGDLQIDQVYYQVGKFYFESGWKEQARNMFEQTLQLNPQNESAKQVLENFTQSV